MALLFAEDSSQPLRIYVPEIALHAIHHEHWYLFRETVHEFRISRNIDVRPRHPTFSADLLQRGPRSLAQMTPRLGVQLNLHTDSPSASTPASLLAIKQG